MEPKKSDQFQLRKNHLPNHRFSGFHVVNLRILTWASAKEPKVTKAKPRNLGGFWVVKFLVVDRFAAAGG